MLLTEKQILKNSNISTKEILLDIELTNVEVKNKLDELRALKKSPSENKLKILFCEVNVEKRETFIKQLKEIVNYRKKQLCQV